MTYPAGPGPVQAPPLQRPQPVVGGYGAGPVQVMGVGGGNLQTIQRILRGRELAAEYKKAMPEYEPVARSVVELADGGDMNTASRILAREHMRLSMKFGAETAQQLTAPGWQYLASLDTISQREQGGNKPGGVAQQTAIYDPATGVKLSQVTKNVESGRASRAREGLYTEQAETERKMRPLVESGQMSLTELRGAQTGAAQGLGGYRKFQTEQLGPAQVDAAKAQAERDRAAANKPPGSEAPRNAQTPQLLRSIQRSLMDMQDIGKMGLADADRATSQMRGEIDSLNAAAEREGWPLRYGLDTTGGVAVLTTQPAGGGGAAPQGQGQGPSLRDQALSPGPPPTPSFTEMIGQGGGTRGTPAAAVPPAIPATPPPPEMTPLPTLPQPTPTAARAPADVTDLSRLVPESSARLERGENVPADQLIAEATKNNVTDPKVLEAIYMEMARKYGSVRPGEGEAAPTPTR